MAGLQQRRSLLVTTLKLLLFGFNIRGAAASLHQSRRWERMDGRALGGGGGSSSSSSIGSSLQGSSLPSGLSSSGRRACSFYVWDAPSALLHKWCHHLLKDCVYEGLGGRKFVRIEPGSILQLLYPCSRYSPDRCVVCGGTFRDHLTLWWGKHLYTPFDRSMDDTFAAGSVMEYKYPAMMDANSSISNGKRRRQQHQRRRNRATTTNTRAAAAAPKNRGGKGNKNKSSSNGRRRYPAAVVLDRSNEMIRVFAFHRKYVTDAASLAPPDEIPNVKERLKRINREKAKLETKIGRRMEWRRHTNRRIFYAVPTPYPPTSSSSAAGGGKNTKKTKQSPAATENTKQQQQQRRQSITADFTRYLVLNSIHRLISMQEAENDKIRKNERAGGCCS